MGQAPIKVREQHKNDVLQDQNPVGSEGSSQTIESEEISSRQAAKVSTAWHYYWRLQVELLKPT